MSGQRRYSFGDHVLDLQRGALLKAGADVRLRPKSFEVLRLLIERHGQLVTKDELLSAVWGHVIVTEGSLTQCLRDVRRAIGDESQQVIRTVPRRGYIFDVPVIESDGVTRTEGERHPPVPSAPTLKRVSGLRAGALLAAVVTLAAAATWSGFITRGMTPDAPSKTAAARADDNSIAILPFVDLSAGQDQGYLADGLAEEILNRLAQTGQLRVIARTSSFSFRDRPMPVQDIAATLNVSHVLEGSIRRSGDRVRITAQLIEASSNSHVWSETYDHQLGDLFALQDEIATAVAAALDVALVGGMPNRQIPASAEAYDAFLQGQFFHQRRAPGDFERSARYFEQAVALDPGYAAAWAALSGAYSFLAESDLPSAQSWRDRQGDAARKAVELDPGLAVAHQRLAVYYGQTGDFQRAEVHALKALELDPNDPLVMGGLVSQAISRGDLDEAISIQRRVIARDPLSPLNRNILGVLLLGTGQLDEAMSEYRKILDLNPDAGPDVRIDIVRILVLQQRYDEAYSTVAQLTPGNYRDFGLALLYQAPDRRAEADAALARLAAGPGDFMDGIRLAEVYAYRGMRDDALSSLQRQKASLAGHGAAAQGWITYFQDEIRVSPFLASLHDDPRWHGLLAAPG